MQGTVIDHRNGHVHIIRAFPNGFDCHAPCALDGVSIDAGRNQRESDGAAALGVGNLHGILVAAVQKTFFVAIAALPDGANGVDDVLCLQLEARGDDRLAGGTVPQSVAGGLKFPCTGSREDRSADTAAVAELAVGCVDDAVHVHFGDALFPDA